MCWWLCTPKKDDLDVAGGGAEDRNSPAVLDIPTTKDTKDTGRIQRRPSKTLKGKVPHKICTVTDVNLKYKFSYSALGKGATSVVRVAQEKSTGNKFAVKVVNIAGLRKSELDKLLREVEIMKTLDHPNIVKLLEVFQTPYRLFLVMELCTGGELYDALASKGSYTEFNTAHLVEMMLSAIRYCHSKGIVHRDLKLENFVFEDPKSSRLKLIDFGLSSVQVSASFRNKAKIVADAPMDSPRSRAEANRSRQMSPAHMRVSRMTTFVGTVYYVAPEMFLGSYDEKVDVWSIGIITYMLLTGRPPYDGDTFSDIQRLTRRDVKFDPDEDAHVSPTARAFIQSLLCRDPDERVDAVQALKLPWITTNLHKKRRDSKAATVPASVASSLASFSKMSALKRTALLLMAHHLAGKDLERLRKLFEAFDKDNSGRISLPELQNVMKQSNLLIANKSDDDSGDGTTKTADIVVDASPHQTATEHGLTRDDLKKIFVSLDHDNSGRIQFTQFMAAMISQKSVTDDKLKELFGRLDEDGSGFITAKDLRAVLGGDYTRTEAQEILRDSDLDGDGKITWSEFVKIMRKKSEKGSE